MGLVDSGVLILFGRAYGFDNGCCVSGPQHIRNRGVHEGRLDASSCMLTTENTHLQSEVCKA